MGGKLEMKSVEKKRTFNLLEMGGFTHGKFH